ncbi:hypothetical protein BG011_004313 [Mortierella polycephala]|uniref:Vacuolar import and degradation protein n=1 Tax=Mortierella polycephala TaxID=41804 RepID=A0A9P6Q228_9FUNG|nr:hypothetical protein BG011_004313 [Mortierella polycephala]
MPVFARISTVDPVEATSIASTANESLAEPLSDAICTCSDLNIPCDVHSSNNNASVLTQLKQQAVLKQQQHLAQQKQCPRDPFESVRLPPTRTCHLYPGSKFQGRQKSGKQSYEVIVDIKHVNLSESTLCGYLHIKGLTEEYPELTTFFDAEIVGPRYSFLTRKWDATEETDKDHWTLFPPFEHLASIFRKENAKFDFRDQEVVFMRWKEHFLVPDHRVKGITGASFAGFYYICYHKLTGLINGYYYHQSSDK